MLLEAKDISFQYTKNNIILDHVSFTVNPGERVALIGPSGCGKSTLAQILSGYLPPSSGSVLLNEIGRAHV